MRSNVATIPQEIPAGRRLERLSLKQARGAALAAQGLADSRPATPPAGARLASAIERLGLLQLDSVSVVVRAHYMPLFSRLGDYARDDLDRLAAHHPKRPRPQNRRLFEYWAHEASLLPVALQPLLRWRMADAEAGRGMWKGIASFGHERSEVVRRVLGEIERRGALGVSDLEDAGSRSGAWWGWNDGKLALEYLFWTGRITAAGRRGFERLYDLPERVLPDAVLATPTPDREEAQRALLARAATALGVATAADLRDYYRLPLEGTAARLEELVEAGSIQPVAVEGWRQPAFMAAGARLPRRPAAHALLAPFDPLVFERSRVERLFDFNYRIEIYVPAAKRRHGYYVLPFLMGDRLAARVDLKTERRLGRLLVRAAYLEQGQAEGPVAEALAAELRLIGRWLGLERIEVASRGDLAAALRQAPGMDVQHGEEIKDEAPASS